MPRGRRTFTISEAEGLLKSLRSKKQDLMRRRAKLQKELSEIDETVAKIDGAGGGMLSRPRNAKPLAQVAQEVLKDLGKPMRVADIADAALKAGYKSSSASFRAIVNQLLIKDKQFVSTERGFYGLKKA